MYDPMIVCHVNRDTNECLANGHIIVSLKHSKVQEDQKPLKVKTPLLNPYHLKQTTSRFQFTEAETSSLNSHLLTKMIRNWVVVLVWGCIIGGAVGIRFVIDREECFSHKVQYGDTVTYSFVVIKVDSSWHYNDKGVDLVVKGPSGEQMNDFRDKISEKSDFVAYHEGVYRFCFTNNSPYHETIDFDVHAGHFTYHEEHAKDEHFKPLYEHIGKLEEALYNIQYEQHWLEAQTDRQAIVNEGMSKRAIHKAMFESVALIGASILQVFLLRRLFERKLGTGRV